MTLQEYIDDIKLELTGNLLHLEIPDDTLALVVKKALREINRYVDETRIMTIPYSKCIDLGEFKVSAVTKIYRVDGYAGYESGSISADPMWMAQWQILCGGGDMYNLSDWVLNYSSWNTLLQIRNTVSTDLAFKFDRSKNKLYINTYLDNPALITVEYIPIFEDVQEVKTEYWQDILRRLSIALTKQILGRIRSKYKQSNSLWTTDGDTLLEESKEELTQLRTLLSENDNLLIPID